ncbi:hypothetical protein AXF42_Ash019862 [Apostasia shenzhenica]|uniref:U-box domain-containing protein 4 n=1 Tax=Apostasia shenzhenica TaxID=1088818 RepID=A0A2H9ZX20_9ASPA|nr:hypothetical protein AXF42_Ash019862 [Apostasia shenzhenica]
MSGGEAAEVKEEVLRALEALKVASKGIETNPGAFADESSRRTSPFANALLALHTAAGDLLSGDPRLSTLSLLLSRLQSLASSCPPSSLRRRRSVRREISHLAASIASEIESWIHRESLDRLVSLLLSPSPPAADKEGLLRLLLSLESRLSHGFDFGLQDAILRSGALPAVEAALVSPSSPEPLRDRCAVALLALVRFNKDVFVGKVMAGPAIGCLVAMGSAASLRALAGLIVAIRSPLIDVLLADGEILKIVAYLASPDLDVRVNALDCVLGIAYYGRKEAVDGMMEAGAVERLMDLQRPELAGGWGGGMEKGSFGVFEGRPFVGAVARLAVGVEVGEGLRQREKRGFKLELLRRAREAAADEAEAATVAGEILWGTTSW